MNRIRTWRPRLPTVLLSTVLLFGIFGARAFASQQLTIDDCIRLGLERNPQLVTSRAGVVLAEARKRETVAGRLPSLKLTSGYAHLNPEPPFVISLPVEAGKSPVPETIIPAVNDNYSVKLTLQQPVFTGFRLDHAIRIAADNAAAARSDYVQDRAQLVYNIKSGYWRLVQALRAKKIVERNIERMEGHLADIGNFEAQGMATRNDVLKVEVQLANARLADLDARNGVRLSGVALDNLCGLPLDTEIEPASVLPDSEGTVSSTTLGFTTADSTPLPALIDSALARRPEVKATAARVKARVEGVGFARAAWFPQLMATGDYYYALPNQRQFPQKDRFSASWDVGLGLSWNVWDWGTAGFQTAQAEALLRQAQAAFAVLKNGIALEVTQDYLNWAETGEKVKVARTGLAQAEENENVARAGFKVGSVLTSDLLDAGANLLQAELNLTQARTDQEISRAKLEKTIGSK